MANFGRIAACILLGLSRSTFWAMSAAANAPTIVTPFSQFGDAKLTELEKKDTAASHWTTGKSSSLSHPAHRKRDLESVNVCWQMTLNDPGNNPGERNPFTWWRALEWYGFINATCIRPGHGAEFRVYCQKLRHLGLPGHGPELLRYGWCPKRKVCLNRLADHNPEYPLKISIDIECVPEEDLQIRIIQAAERIKRWCSVKYLLASHPSARSSARTNSRASFRTAIEVRKESGEIEEADLWIEVVADWWKYGHSFAARTGSVTSGIINNAPALGNTYVKFCANIAADTIHKVRPLIEIIYSITLVNTQHRGLENQNNMSMSSAASILDVLHEPSGQELSD